MGDAMSLDQVKALMNAETLYPQKTGYIELDRMLEELVAPYKGKDTYTTLKGLYDWTVNNIDYSWDGYSQNYAPAYDCFTLTYDLKMCIRDRSQSKRMPTWAGLSAPMVWVPRAFSSAPSWEHSLNTRVSPLPEWAITAPWNFSQAPLERRSWKNWMVSPPWAMVW